MKRTLLILIFGNMLLFASSTIAADKIVVIPLPGGEKTVVVESGQTKCTYYNTSTSSWEWDDTCTNATRPPGQDGELQKGADLTAPRFTDNNDGTITDNQTGLLWLKNANCGNFHLGDVAGSNTRNWTSALTDIKKLASGYCGLTDSSVAGDWRVPNIIELFSLVNWNYYYPTISNAAGTGWWSEGDPFTGIQTARYWSTTSDGYSSAWMVSFSNGAISGGYKETSTNHYVLPIFEGDTP